MRHPEVAGFQVSGVRSGFRILHRDKVTDDEDVSGDRVSSFTLAQPVNADESRPVPERLLAAAIPLPQLLRVPGLSGQSADWRQ
jgi:hypothetical protein